MLKHIHTEKPRKYEGYYQACHQEVTERLTPPTSDPLRRVPVTTAAWWPAIIPFHHEAVVFVASNVFRIQTAYFTKPGNVVISCKVK